MNLCVVLLHCFETTPTTKDIQMIWKWIYGKLSAAKSHTLSLSSLGNALGWGRWPSSTLLLQLYPWKTCNATQRLSKHVRLRMPILIWFVRRKALRQLCEVLGVEVGLTSAMIAIGLKLFIEPWWNAATMVLYGFVAFWGALCWLHLVTMAVERLWLPSCLYRCHTWQVLHRSPSL